MKETSPPFLDLEANTTPKFDFDKISALKYLKNFGIHVPKTFKDFAEAEEFAKSNSKLILGRGFTLGEEDNLCIDVFPSFIVNSAEQLKSLQQQCLKIKRSTEFAVYADQFGVDTEKIKPQVALQEMIGIPGVTSVSMITLNNGPNEIMVQMRDQGGKSYGRIFPKKTVAADNKSDLSEVKLNPRRRSLQPLIEAAAQLHLRTQKFLPDSSSIQMEMAAAVNLKMSAAELALIQVRKGSSQENSPINWIKEKDLATLEKDSSKLEVKRIENIQPKKNSKLHETLGIDNKQPYRLILKKIPSPKRTIPMEMEYGNLKELIILDPRAKEVCLQHDTYKIMKLVWLRGGKVSIIH